MKPHGGELEFRSALVSRQGQEISMFVLCSLGVEGGGRLSVDRQGSAFQVWGRFFEQGNVEQHLHVRRIVFCGPGRPDWRSMRSQNVRKRHYSLIRVERAS